jgi:hypothetical protein
MKISDLRKIIREEIQNVVSDNDPYKILADEVEGNIYTAHRREGAEICTVKCTSSTWEDGVPNLKAINRSSEIDITLPETFQVVEDEKYGWLYFKIENLWCGINIEQYGGSPPFDY